MGLASIQIQNSDPYFPEDDKKKQQGDARGVDGRGRDGDMR